MATNLESLYAAYFKVAGTEGYSLPPVKDPGDQPPPPTSYGYASTTSMGIFEIFMQWMGREPNATERNAITKQGWNEDTVRRHAISYGGNGPLMQAAQDRVRQIAAAYYDGDPSIVPDSLVNTLISSGLYADESYLSQTYFPKIRGAGLNNPLAQPFIDAWTELTGRPVNDAAMQQLDQLVRVYGFTDVAQQAFLTWAKQTDSAITGNFGAAERERISATIRALFGREATEQELAAPGTVVAPKEVTSQERARRINEWAQRLMQSDPTLDRGEALRQAEQRVAAEIEQQGKLTLPEGVSLWDLSDEALIQTLRGMDEYKSIYAGKPAWMNEQDWIAEARAMDAVLHWYYGDNMTTNEDGSITIGGVTVTPEQAQAGAITGLKNFGIDYITADMLGMLLANGYTAEHLQQDFKTLQSAEEMAGVYDEILTEVYGSTFSLEEWQTLVAGGMGSGELKARLAEAQNRIAYREAYREVFGVDPDVADYDRIMNEYISPSELLKTHQAEQSAAEMYEQINDLLMRVYGDSVTVDELKNMALGREGSGELKALISTATKLDEFRAYHKQYYGAEATPDDYAKYAGYVSPAELQWEIVAREAVAENMPDIQEGWNVAFPDEPMLTEEDLYKMYKGEQGYGELRYKVKEAQEKQQEKEQAEDWAYRGAERAGIGYTTAPSGGFRVAAPGLADL